MKLALSEGNVGIHDVKALIDLASETGFEGVLVNIRSIQDYLKTYTIGEVKGWFTRVKPVCFSIGRGSIEEIERDCSTAYAIGCTIGQTVTSALSEEERKVLVKRIKDVANIAKKYDVKVSCEFIGCQAPNPMTSEEKKQYEERVGRPYMWRRSVMPDIKTSIQFLEDVSADNVGLTLDTYHWYTGECTLKDIEVLGQDRIIMIHINDAPNRPVKELYDFARVMPGDGVIDLKGFLHTVKRIGYDGFVTLEIVGRSLVLEKLVSLGPKAAALKIKKNLDGLMASI